MADTPTVPDLRHHVDEHHHDEHRTGGFLRQDDPAGPALPTHHTTSEHA